MGMLQFKNNATTTLSGSINDSQTSVTVANSSSFPVLAGSDYFYATMYEDASGTEINIEVVKVTATSGTNWTIARAQDGTTARSRSGVVTTYIEQRWTAASAQLMLQKDNNLSDLASASTARTNLGLGTLATQNSNNVTITGGTISGVSFTTIDSSSLIVDNVDQTKKLAFEVSGVTTGTTRTLTIPNASGTIALLSDLSAGYQPLDTDLTALAALAANGIIARTGSGTVTVRTIAVPASGMTITNGDGVSGNPTIALADDLAAVEGLATTGFVRRTGVSTWSASAIVDGDLPSALTSKTYNALTLTANATGFSLAGGTTSKTLTIQNTMTLAGTDGTTITLPTTTGTVALNNQTVYIGTTGIAINRASASLSLTGVSIDGSAGSATTATTATKSIHLVGGNNTTLLGAIGYQSNTDTTTLLSPNTTATKLFLSQTGTGTNGAAPAWGSVSKSDVGLANVENTALSTWAGSTNITTLGTVATGTWNATAIGIAKGGTGQTTAVAAFDALAPSTTVGDTIYHNGTDNVRLAGNITTTKQFLRSTGNGAAATAPAWDTLVNGDIPSALTGKTYNALSLTAEATGFTIAGGTTSKTLTVSNTLTLAGTDASTLNIGAGGTLGTAAFVATSTFAPAAGSSSITTVGTITSGTWTGSAIGISYGGTGSTSKAAGFNALSPVTTLGDLVYGDGANSNTRLAGNTTATKLFLTQTGTGTVSAAPAWGALANADIPSALTGKTYNGLTLTANATGFQIAGGTTAKTFVVSNNLTLAGTDGSTLNIGGGGTLGSAAFTASSAYQAADADLTAIAALAGTTGFLKKTAANTWSLDTTSYLSGTVGVANGGTGATTLTGLIKGNGTSAFTAASASDVTTALGFTPVRQGGGAGQLSNTVYVGWNGSGLNLQVDATDFANTWPINVSGSAATVTNGVYTTGNQTIAGDKTFTGTTTTFGSGTTSAISVDGWRIGVGPTGSNSGYGGGIVYRDDTGANRWKAGIEGTAGGTKWHIYDYIAAAERLGIASNGDINVGANFTAAGNVTAYSDERLKENWRDLDNDFLPKLAQVKHGIYDRIGADGLTQVGVSAQSLEIVLPHAVLTGHDGIKSVAYGNAALTAAVALARKVVELEARLAALEA